MQFARPQPPLPQQQAAQEPHAQPVQQMPQATAQAAESQPPQSPAPATDSAGGGTVVIAQDTHIKGEIRGCGRMEIMGYFEGAAAAKALIIHPGGRFFGQLRADNAEIAGTLQGEAAVRHLMHVTADGSVTGNIQYGRISIEPGGDLSADLRNIPPEIAGDMNLSVSRGQSVVITTLDLTAIDPDDDAQSLTYAVSGETGGHVAMASAPQTPVKNFTQAHLEAGQVIFQHAGGSEPAARFNVVVHDAKGATSGQPQTITVAVAAQG